MLSNRRRPRAAAVVIAAGTALVLGACTSPQAPSGNTGSATPTTQAPTPQAGGTLKLAAAEDPGRVDLNNPGQINVGLLRGLTRQLVSYESGPEFSSVVQTIVADAATEVPSPDNGTDYTFTLRDGLQWDAPDGARAVTSEDFARGLERSCHPLAPAAASDYFRSAIVGYGDFCDEFMGLGEEPTLDEVKSFMADNDIEGVTTPDDDTIVITLSQPTSDFLAMLTLPAASAVPVEMLDYEPGSTELRQNWVSSGPYRIAEYEPGTSMVLERNPAWSAESDELRAAHVDRVEIDFGVSAGQAHDRVVAGTAHTTLDVGVPPGNLPALLDADDPRLQIVSEGAADYLAVNMQSEVADGALQDVKVRQALNWAVDRAAVVQQLGGPELAEPLYTVLPPALLGHKPAELYVTDDDRGDTERAKELLADAGHADGLTLRLLHPNEGTSPDIAEAVQASLAEAGVTVELKPMDVYEMYDLLYVPENSGEWDLVLLGWGPDWYNNAARTFFVPLLASDGMENLGLYSSEEVDRLIAEAVAEPQPMKAADLWAQADAAAMEDGAWVPLVTGRRAWFHSDDLQGWAWNGASATLDYTSVSLQP